MRNLGDYKNRPTIQRRALYVCLAIAVVLLLTVLFADLEIPFLLSILLNVLAFALVAIGSYYLLFRRTGAFVLNAERKTQERLKERLLQSGPEARDVALVIDHDDHARDAFGGTMASGGVVWLLEPVIGNLLFHWKLLFFLIFVGVNAWLLLRVVVSESKLK